MPHSLTNPKVCGFPLVTADRIINKLEEKGYTVVVIRSGIISYISGDKMML
jgi:hypothetical protein